MNYNGKYSKITDHKTIRVIIAHCLQINSTQAVF
ncbi:hypothetical protein T09_4139 [Trichinella sp. T9]|nr:hypothetical protein T09_4139 [Trichinella sp. T9]